ncbi:cysteine-rich KTR domain-containing protein [Gemmiger formicilis]
MNFPLFCPKCRRETVISVKGLDVVTTVPERK